MQYECFSHWAEESNFKVTHNTFTESVSVCVIMLNVFCLVRTTQVTIRRV